MIVYLDNSATTRQHGEVTKQMVDVSENFYGNPSALHRMGIAAEKLVKTARKQVARPLSAEDECIFFTSGGTEANNTAIFGVVDALKRKGNHIITSSVEHPAVLECCKKLEKTGFKISYLQVDKTGKVSLEELKNAIQKDTILISVMHVNNELGTVQPVGQIGGLAKKHGISFHCDAVQSYGKIPILPEEMHIDFLSASAHKIHGPKGVGLLYVKKNSRIEPFFFGGGQERGFRSGTENTPGIAGFGKAAEIAESRQEENLKRVTGLRNHLLEGLQAEIADIKVNSPLDDGGIPYVLNVSFLGTRGEVLLHTLEQWDIYVGTGSACASRKKGSHVLAACGLTPRELEGAIRFSFSPENTLEEIEFTIEKVKKAVGDIRKMMKLAGK